MRRLAIATLTAALALGLAACGSKTPDPGPSQPSGLTGEGTLGDGPSDGATPTASSTPSAGTTPTGPSLPPPSSKKANKAGFVWVSNATATHTASTAYQYNSAGGAINIAHNGVGRYVVYFNGLATQGGVAHAQAYGYGANYCAIGSWYPTDDVQNVEVNCFAPDGSPADTTFVASFAEGSQGSSRFAYLWADDSGATATYKPSAGYRYDSVDQNLITVRRTGSGKYEAYLPTAGNFGGKPWTFQVTAYGSNNLCKLTSFANRKAQIACRTPGGALVNSQFSLTFASGASIVGRTDRPFNAFSEDSDGLENPSAGVYTVRAPDLGQAKGQVVVVARGTSSTYCHVRNWSPAGSDLAATMVCFNPGGTPAASSFELAVTL